MSQENVELVRALQIAPDVDLAAVLRDDARAEALIGPVAPMFDVEFECVTTQLGGRRYAGLRGLRTAWLEWLEPWETYRVEVEDVLDAGDAAVVLTRDFGRRPGMQDEVRLLGAAIWTVRNGKILRAEFHADRNDALEAAGLSK